MLTDSTQYFWISNFPFYTTFDLCKGSILALYLQIFPRHLKIYLAMLYTVIAYSAIGYIVSVSLALFMCYPVQRQWYVGQP